MCWFNQSFCWLNPNHLGGILNWRRRKTLTDWSRTHCLPLNRWVNVCWFNQSFYWLNPNHLGGILQLSKTKNTDWMICIVVWEWLSQLAELMWSTNSYPGSPFFGQKMYAFLVFPNQKFSSRQLNTLGQKQYLVGEVGQNCLIQVKWIYLLQIKVFMSPAHIITNAFNCVKYL